MVRQIFRYAYGRMETSGDDATICQLFRILSVIPGSTSRTFDRP